MSFPKSASKLFHISKAQPNTFFNGHAKQECAILKSPFIYSFTFCLTVISNHVNHVNPAYHTSNRPAGSGTNANASAYSTVISDSLVKVILILLSGLLLANSVLFYKMWDLEAKLGSPLSNLEEVLFEATREHGASMDRTTWLKILQRQEAAHQLELQKWHDLLGTAASLLKQVFCSLFKNNPKCLILSF